MVFKRWGDRIQPMGTSEVVAHLVCRLDILDTERDDGDALVKGLVDFVQNVVGSIAIRRPDEDKYFAGIDSPYDGLGEIRTGGDVTRGDPNADSMFLQFGANSVSDDFVFR